MTIDAKWFGGVLLIAGVSIGGAMLALPLATAPSGLVPSAIFFVFCWAIMTFCAFLLLEANLWLPAGSHLISMAKASLGRAGESLAWFTYLLLLYALLCAYIAGGTELLENLMTLGHMTLPHYVAAIIFTGTLAIIVYQGIRSVDMVNRTLMLGKLGVLALLMLMLVPHVDMKPLSMGHPKAILGSMMVVVTSFGFAIIIPSLREYFDSDVNKLRSAIFVGTLIPLIVYLAWITLIMGVVPNEGQHGLLEILSSGHSSTALTTGLCYSLHNAWITAASRVFTSVCMLTAFLGVSLCLFDFLSDGLSFDKFGRQGLVVFAATFLPPLALVLIQPHLFVKALSYAGVLVVILLILLPTMIVWGGRYQKQLATGYQVWGGKPALLMTLFCAIALIILGW